MSIYNPEKRFMRINKIITIGVNALIFSQILSTNSLRKCIENIVENLYVDIGNGGNDISVVVVVDSQHLSWIATVTGIVFTIVFYIGTKESKASTHQEVRDDEKGKSSATLELRVLQHEREENSDSEQAHFSTW